MSSPLLKPSPGFLCFSFKTTPSPLLSVLQRSPASLSPQDLCICFLLSWECFLFLPFNLHYHSASSYSCLRSFPGAPSGKEPACQRSRHSRYMFDPGLGSSPGGGHNNPLQYSCLKNPMDRGTWRATVQRVTWSWT